MKDIKEIQYRVMETADLIVEIDYKLKECVSNIRHLLIEIEHTLIELINELGKKDEGKEEE